MKIPMTLEITHTVDCRRCGHEVSSGSEKGSYLKLLVHLKFTCPDRKNNDIPFLKTIWGLIKWKRK